MHPRFVTGLALLFMAVGATAAPAGAGADTACTRFASPGGSDTAAGSEGSPYRTAQRLVDALAAGETGCLRQGAYVQRELRLRGGRVGAPVTLRAYGGERARIAGGIIYVPDSADHVTISDLAIDGSAVPGEITVQVMGDDVALLRNDVTNHGAARSCMVLGSLAGYGQARQPVVSGNRFDACGDRDNGNHDHAIYAENVVGARIVDNVLRNSAAWAIHLYPNARGSLIAHNVIDGNGGGVIFAGEGAGGEYPVAYASSDNVVEHNVISNSRDELNVQAWWGGPVGTGNVARSNCVFNGAKGDIGTATGFSATGNVVADPRYVDRAGGDLRLARDSPCLAVVGHDTAARAAGGAAVPGPGSASAAARANRTNRAPRVRLRRVGGGRATSRWIRVVATVRDDTRGARVRFYVNGALVVTRRSAPYAATLTLTRRNARRRHIIRGTAVDADGARGSASMKVLSRRAGR